MHILIANPCIIPVTMYGGTERVIWYLGKELTKMGHQVTYLVNEGSHCDFADVLFLDKNKSMAEQIPESVDVVHFNFPPDDVISKPYIITMHGNVNDQRELDKNTVFVSQNHANRFGANSFVHNGLDWDDYGKPDLTASRSYFHFLGKAAWRIKNVKGAIDTINLTRKERLKVLGGYRLNFNMGFRLTLSPRIHFHGMVGGEKKNRMINKSKGLVFPVRWHEPFGLALTESLYFGCPVFGTPYGSLPELVNKEVGFLSANKKTLAAALENSHIFSARHCHEYALELFNSKRMAESYVNKYETVLNGGTLNNTPPQLKEVQNQKFLSWE